MYNKRCSDVHGDLSLVVDGFRGKRCDDTSPEANIAEYLVVDEETYRCVKSFCFVLCGTLLMEMVERIWLLHIESGMDE